MKETLAAAEGAGLAAPQVGVLRRAVIIIDDEGGYIEMVNPVITQAEGSQDGPEGCLSVPGRYGMVERPRQVTVRIPGPLRRKEDAAPGGLFGPCRLP